MKESYYIQNGFYLGSNYLELPSFGYEQAARLLCFKDKNYTISKYNFGTLIEWKFNCKNQ